MEKCYFCDNPKARYKVKNKVGVIVSTCFPHYRVAIMNGWKDVTKFIWLKLVIESFGK